MSEAVASRPRTSPFGALRRTFEGFTDPARALELAGAMTLLLLLRYSEPIWYLELGVYGLVVMGLLHRPLLRSAPLWLLITAFLVVGHARLWFAIDNHKYLITYWTLAFGLSLMSPSPAQALRQNARLLIGLAFALAVLAKVVSPDYLSGGFFANLLVTDSRFLSVASVLGGLPFEELRASALARQDLLVFGDLTAPVAMPSSARLAAVAQVLTWWTLLIEAAVAALFLWPEERGPSRWRDAALLAFIATTYPVAPVVGFAWVLASMGVAQASRHRTRLWVALYVGAYLLVMLSYYLPFARALGLA